MINTTYPMKLAFILYFLVFMEVQSKYLEGYLKTVEDWHFLARFCFLSKQGRLKFEFQYPKEYFEPQHILLYFDDPDQWPAVYKSDKNCYQKEAALYKDRSTNQVIFLTLRYNSAGCSVVEINSTLYYQCSEERTFISARERWWYIAASHCGGLHNCTEKTSPPHIIPENNQEIILEVGAAFSGCEYYGNEVHCAGDRYFQSARERWWFITASRCIPKNGVVGLDLHYKLWLTNGAESDLFFYHFSADEFYILQVDIAFLLAMFVLLVLTIICAVVLKKRQLFHTTYKMFLFSLSTDVLHLLFMCIAFGKYANDGLDMYPLETTGRVFEAAGQLMFLLMLILMAKGYTITRGRISKSGSIKISVFMTVYTITYMVLFVYEALGFDPGEVLYLYESPPGYGLVGLRLLGWIWFCYATFFTLKHYPEKGSFYYPFFIFYTIWFWAGPLTVIISSQVIGLWMREKIVNGIEVAIAFFGQVFFLILTRPSAANKNFPYHVKTTQIGVMDNAPHIKHENNNILTSDENTTQNSLSTSDGGETVHNAAPNLMALFNVSNSRSAKYVKEENGGRKHGSSKNRK